VDCSLLVRLHDMRVDCSLLVRLHDMHVDCCLVIDFGRFVIQEFGEVESRNSRSSLYKRSSSHCKFC
jgi:hypothetical protein